ncbi:MAG: alpha/beta hydrolase, partial [Candidatus Binataceae bacterium]
VVLSRCGGERPALVGHSWGSMLALAYGAAHPGSAGPIVLIGCGTFDKTARARMRAIEEERMDDELRRRLERLAQDYPDPNERLRALGALTLGLYSYDLVTTEQEIEVQEAGAKNDETWKDMVRLQDEGVYPAAFEAIDTPVLMLHGIEDPHPGRLIRASLQPFLAHLEYRELERCGHYPWLERHARDEFFSILRDWLTRHIGG